jgi:hypothetical protein
MAAPTAEASLTAVTRPTLTPTALLTAVTVDIAETEPLAAASTRPVAVTIAALSEAPAPPSRVTEEAAPLD